MKKVFMSTHLISKEKILELMVCVGVEVLPPASTFRSRSRLLFLSSFRHVAEPRLLRWFAGSCMLWCDPGPCVCAHMMVL